MNIVTKHESPNSPHLPIVVCWGRSGSIVWATVEPPHSELANVLAEVTGELSVWLHSGGKLQQLAALCSMPPESAHERFLVWLSEVECRDGESVATKYAVLDAVED